VVFLCGNESVQVCLTPVYVDTVVGDQVIKERRVGTINRFNTATVVYMSQARAWSPNFVVSFMCNDLRW
jgi:hypothetical protein